jgi:hypothetical protein
MKFLVERTFEIIGEDKVLIKDVWDDNDGERCNDYVISFAEANKLKLELEEKEA